MEQYEINGDFLNIVWCWK